MTDESKRTNLVRTETDVILPSEAILKIDINVSYGTIPPTDTERAGLAIALSNLNALVLAGVKSAKEQGLGVKPSLGNRLKGRLARARKENSKQQGGE